MRLLLLVLMASTAKTAAFCLQRSLIRTRLARCATQLSRPPKALAVDSRHIATAAGGADAMVCWRVREVASFRRVLTMQFAAASEWRDDCARADALLDSHDEFLVSALVPCLPSRFGGLCGQLM